MWKHTTLYKGKTFEARHSYYGNKTMKMFMYPEHGTGKRIPVISWQQAKKNGWKKIKVRK